jgi:hypothetical protein
MPAVAWPRASVEEPPIGVERHSVDAAHGAARADLPEAYPSFQTCHRRFQQWVHSGVMKGILEALALDLKLRGAIDVREAFIDASFAPAKKGG